MTDTLRPDQARPDYAQLFRLDGRTAVVIGAGSGIGRESAQALAAQGARVVCADIDGPAAKEVAALIGGDATAYELDVRDREAVQRAAEELGDVDVLVLTAGTHVRKRLLDYSVEEFERVISLNLTGTFDVLRAFGARMVERGRGSIIAFSSMRAVTVEPGQGVYSASKAGVAQLIRSAATEFGPYGVRANAIAPGIIETPLTAQIMAQPHWYQAYADKSVLGRWGRAPELAGAVVYLASDASSFVTGAVLPVDGGWTVADGRFEPPAT
ncbi:SDR family NAD(P)-dependent oxidoreductase [Streptacidiphilus jiangxiensis]|uniref:NAD(P)-dependent dehydrogenase, short-chain alcohol dehydrogenase family n=1 Tax=Streptacidiphilus jiangxiensis TaxID=235985 RepID=A0A1H7VNZ0_STRJI|nr:SDR family NAD(P)-dependent oxidoreductase [Streptacidiphilus jiangxiensis]SEM10956.1 NAD(P)-dependent dehydrogenase, short-chain alcohol dehydrogenase family [Streptacidiphilus jiangxiensis]